MTLHQIVERERRGIARFLSLAVAGFAGAGAVAVLLLGVVALGGSRWLSLPRALPFLFWLAAAGAGWAVVRFLRRTFSPDASVARVAQAVENERELRVGSLRGVLEVADSGALGRLGASVMSQRLERLGGPSLAPAYRGRAARRTAFAGGATLAGVLGMVSAAAAAPDGLRAILHPVAAWRGTLLGAVELGEVPGSVLRGEAIEVVLHAPGREQVEFAERVTGSSWRTRAVPITGDSALVRLGPLDADLSLFVTDGRSTSDTATVKVVDKPFVGDVNVRASFPAYLGRREETLPLGEVVRVPRGTVLDIDGQSSTELRSVVLSRGADRVEFAPRGRSFTGRLMASTSGRFEWSATGTMGAIADLPPALELEVLADSAPTVEIISPSRDSVVNTADTIAVSVLATDDHGLAAASLRISITSANGDVRTSTTRPLPGATGGQFAGTMSLAMNSLVPGDAMRLTAIATDASPWRQVGLSRELVLRLPSTSEQRDAARAAANEAVNQALAAANAQKQLNQRTEDAARARAREAERQKGKDNPMSYEASEQAKQFAREQRQLADRMQQVQDAARDLEKQLKQAGALDSALQSRLREAQKLMREALTPELAEKLRQLEQASQNMSPAESQRALQDLADQQRKLREQLEKSVEMLKRAALEGSMETLKDEARDLAGRQRELVDSLRKADREREQSMAEQMVKEMQEKAKELQKDVADLQKRLQQENAEAGSERVREAGEKIEESMKKLQEAMQQRQQQGQQGQQQGAQNQQGQTGERQQGQQQQQQGTRNQQGQAGERQQAQGERQQGQQGQTGSQGQQQAQNQSAAGNQGNRTGEQQSSAEASAQKAAEAMEQAASELDKARQQQIGEWKKELTGELDQSIQEMLQLARQQDQLEQSARSGAQPGELRSRQSTLQQGVDKAMERLQEAGQKSNLLSQRSMRMMGDAKSKVGEATTQTQRAQTGQQMASAMREASESLNQAAASLVRDRERTQNSESATGFAEMLQQLQEMARQQQGLNSAVQDLLPRNVQQQLSQQAQAEARQLAREQREVAARLEDVSDREDTGRAEELAREARLIAQQLESGQLDPAVLERQQRLFRKMLDAGRLLEEEEREDTGKREAKSWTGDEVYTPSATNASGKSASKFTAPTWNDLRGLTSEERRLVLEYFKRINARP
ncbi:MAG: hypothetical protein ACT4OZ_08615 [Gemmatimonadota bacterium]